MCPTHYTEILWLLKEIKINTIDSKDWILSWELMKVQQKTQGEKKDFKNKKKHWKNLWNISEEYGDMT